MSFLFFISGILISFFNWCGTSKLIQLFVSGAKDFIGVGIVIAIARGISVINRSSGLSNLIVSELTKITNALGPWGSIPVVFVLFILISFLIPSTSGFAAAVFPLIGPSFYAAGISISGALVSFSITNGLVNVALPSGGIFMSAIQITKIPLGKYFKATGIFLAAMTVLALCFLFIGQAVVNNSIMPNDIASQNAAVF